VIILDDKPFSYKETEYLCAGHKMRILPIYKFDESLLKYPDRKVPSYVLWQLYNKLNGFDEKVYELKKIKMFKL